VNPSNGNGWCLTSIYLLVSDLQGSAGTIHKVYPLIILTCYRMVWWMLSRAMLSRLKVVLLRLEELHLLPLWVLAISWISMIVFVTVLLSFIESFIPLRLQGKHLRVHNLTHHQQIPHQAPAQKQRLGHHEN
jgi:hypothetical protein